MELLCLWIENDFRNVKAAARNYFSFWVFIHWHWQFSKQQGKAGDQPHYSLPPSLTNKHWGIYLRLYIWNVCFVFLIAMSILTWRLLDKTFAPIKTGIWLNINYVMFTGVMWGHDKMMLCLANMCYKSKYACILFTSKIFFQN